VPHWRHQGVSVPSRCSQTVGRRMSFTPEGSPSRLMSAASQFPRNRGHWHAMQVSRPLKRLLV
jgi:hypothetical protein